MNKKGMTVVELIVSFSLVMTIVVFLIQIIINLTGIYNNNDKKTELLNKQALISDNINTAFMDKQLIQITECDTPNKNCYKFIYANGDSDTLRINDNILRFEKFTSELNGATFGDLKLDVAYTPTVTPDEYNPTNGIFILTIPINSDINYNFDVKIVYQFNSSISLIDDFFTS